MSKLQTTTSTTRPSSPPTGTLFYESDTNRLLLWDGAQYNVYNRDALSNPTAGTDDLHYSGGLYTNSSANYYITTTPLFHLDATHIDGLSEANMANQTALGTWHDRTSNRYQLDSNRTLNNSGANAAYFDTNISSQWSGGQCTAPAVYNNYWDKFLLDSSMPTALYSQCTVFYICAAPANENISPFGNAGYHVRSGSAANVQFLRQFGPIGSLGGIPAMPSNASSGPYLTIGAQTSTQLYLWDTETGTPYDHPDGDQTSSTAMNLSSIFNVTYPNYLWELIVFGQVLTLTEMNTVKDYLTNKYNGLSDSLDTTAPALTGGPEIPA